jgi:glycosyltransferase involved in cell wall biosynthesis
MKIIVTVHQFLPEYSAGTEVIALGIARELQERGHEVVVVTGYPDPRSLRDNERFDRYTHDGLRVERFRHSPHPMGDQQVVTELAYDNRLFARAFDRLLAEVEPDVVHFVHLARLSAWLIEPCVERGIPTVFTVTDFWPVCPYTSCG